MSPEQFKAALQHTGNAIEDAVEATVRIFYVDAYREIIGLAPVDTGAHRAGVTPHSGDTEPSTFVRRQADSWPNPGDGLARTIAASFKLGDRIGISDTARTSTGFPYGIMIQPPADRPLFGFPAGTKPAVSGQAPRGDYAVVFKRIEQELPGALEDAVRIEMEKAG